MYQYQLSYPSSLTNHITQTISTLSSQYTFQYSTAPNYYCFLLVNVKQCYLTLLNIANHNKIHVHIYCLM